MTPDEQNNPMTGHELSGKSKLFISVGLILWWFLTDFSMVSDGEVGPVIYLLVCTVAWIGYLTFLRLRAPTDQG